MSNPSERRERAEVIVTDVLASLGRALSDFESESVRNLLHYNEHVIAASTLIDQLVEHDVPVSDDTRAKLLIVVGLLGMDGEQWHHIIAMLPSSS